MRELNIGKCIIQKRKERKITQQQLADYIGVSKASVSKWESGLSYPDILLLPQLAAYFNISVDELMGYSPQLAKEDIKKIYNKLSHEFTVKTFDEVMEQCNKLIKKYYSCFPFLLSMVQLLLNYSGLIKDETIKKEIFQQCILLSRRVKEESENISDIKNANTKEALAEMALGNSPKVIHLLDNKLAPYSGDDVILVNAYRMQGETAQAKVVNQILLYNNVINTLALLHNYLSLNMKEPVLFEKIYSQGIQIIESFELTDILTNDVFGIHSTAAQGYLIQQERQKAMDALDRYVNTICSIQFPLSFKANEYFNQVAKWFEDNNCIGTNVPVDEITLKKTFICIVAENPAFTPLREDERYKLIVKKLKEKLGETDECNEYRKS
ncbi:helix-turn-helix domain-containing protein [Clostridium tyrobutyricum]|jgi:transcriptional regulator with XRE-family HTH domain|uniref:helix-turn-helix domain-containing protein n=1 Tax=Clostridium tyrobutyricum TaxID=1519 RepID=UPI00073DADA0|nr:helix-turn-helix transcriptional regulator [Clostridium tyrobutyricum]MBV4428668.1 helix-turn-helix domain-containing protein [Clostridium tyrobutyricum]MBV4443809.1 helix-turn-helix domain-containing protein [Clostridium tyrobutyricum]MBV4447598.1 helix-turn-helix domain-containing protein [Clostridium tyrobutyricum]MCH4198854.1 helix-turn-helix domain-containing protein [Clostridium tyrobutyricum]MCH4238205.1 helix-turn-helix domain-containing protein [Clostridium tyrobutyricum]